MQITELNEEDTGNAKHKHPCYKRRRSVTIGTERGRWWWTGWRQWRGRNQVRRRRVTHFETG